MRALPHLWRLSMEAAPARPSSCCSRRSSSIPTMPMRMRMLGWSYISMFNLDTRRPIGEFTDRALDCGQHGGGARRSGAVGPSRVRTGPRAASPSRAGAELICRERWSLNPNFALGHAGLGYGLAVGGEPELGLESLELRAAAQPARSVPRDLCAGRALHGAVRARTLRGDAGGMPCHGRRSIPIMPVPGDLMTVSLGLLGRTRRGERGARAHARCCSRICPAPTSKTIPSTRIPRIAPAFLKGCAGLD